MGYGNYSYTDREDRAIKSGYHSAPEAQFKNSSLSPLMSPYNLKVRVEPESGTGDIIMSLWLSFQ